MHGGFTLFSARRSKEMLKELTRNKSAVFYDMELLSKTFGAWALISRITCRLESVQRLYTPRITN